MASPFLVKVMDQSQLILPSPKAVHFMVPYPPTFELTVASFDLMASAISFNEALSNYEKERTRSQSAPTAMPF